MRVFKHKVSNFPVLLLLGVKKYRYRCVDGAGGDDNGDGVERKSDFEFKDKNGGQRDDDVIMMM